MRAKRIPDDPDPGSVLLVVACIVPASLMVVALLSYDYHQNRAAGSCRILTATARAIVSAVDRDMAGMQAALLALATSPHLASDDLSAFYDEGHSKRSRPGVQKADNILVVLDPKWSAASQYPAPIWRQAAVRTPIRHCCKCSRPGEPVTADIFRGPVRKEFVLVVAVPVYRGHTIIHALAAAV